MKKLLMVIITLMLAGRAMTLAYIHRAGAGGVGDPPAAWLMPLIGDAIIGISALFVVYLILRGSSMHAWMGILGWNLVAIWDALSAWLIHLSVPWPSFFMIEMFGTSMFFAASAMHLIVLYLAFQPEIRGQFISA